MDALHSFMAKELPRINAYIEQQVDALDELVRPAAAHVLLAGGKRLRPMLTLMTARSMGLAKTVDPYPLACSLEFLHTATLLHDDILDGARLRRGKASAHLVFSRTETILAGDVLLALANDLVASYGVPALTSCLARAVMRTAAGEIAEINNTRVMDPSRATYDRIITGKTAYLIEASCQCGAILAGAAPELEQAAATLGLSAGIAFQLVDDALDYSSPSSVSGKPAGGDLREGKLTLPLILHLQDLPATERDELIIKLKSKSLSDDEIEHIIDHIQRKDLTGHTRREAEEYMRTARDALARFPAGEPSQALDQSLDFVLSRDK